jgi:phospholipid/cholesterol/gamma-HCH transport system ATP-binding protein
MIVFDKVTLYRGNRLILDNISFQIEDDERVAILGSSGEGKTTILKLILRLFKVSSGRIIIDSTDITEKPENQLQSIRRKFSIVFQDGALFDSLSVKENVAFYIREYEKLSEQTIEKKVRELLGRVAVEHAIGLMPEELSGGMQRRVAIARALAAKDSKVFLYDEPTSDLDPVNAEIIRNLINDLAEDGHGFILVTHEMIDALKVARRFMFLHKGHILFDGNKEQLVHSSIPELNMFMRNFGKLNSD